MFNDDPRLRDRAIVRLLLIGQHGCRIGFGFARALVGDVQFQGLVVIGKPKIAQIDPNLAVGEPGLFRGKLGFEKTIIMLTAPHRPPQKEDLAPQTADDGIFY